MESSTRLTPYWWRSFSVLRTCARTVESALSHQQSGQNSLKMRGCIGTSLNGVLAYAEQKKNKGLQTPREKPLPPDAPMATRSPGTNSLLETMVSCTLDRCQIQVGMGDEGRAPHSRRCGRSTRGTAHRPARSVSAPWPSESHQFQNQTEMGTQSVRSWGGATRRGPCTRRRAS
jgi:hypothetical protein